METFELCGQIKVYHENIDFINNHKKSKIEIHAYMRPVFDPHFKFYWSEEKRKEMLDKIKNCGQYLKYHSSLYICNCEEQKQTLSFSTFKLHYSFARPWMIQEVTKQHFLTHYTEIDGELESRLANIKHEFENKQYYKLLGCRSGWDNKSKSSLQILKYGDNRIYHSQHPSYDEDVFV